MKKTLVGAVVGAVAGAVVTGLFSVGISFVEKEEMKEEVVRTLSGYFDSVDQQMSYEEAFKTVYENQQELEKENSDLKTELDTLQKEASNLTSETLEKAKEYVNAKEYSKALMLLEDIHDETGEAEVLASECREQYEEQVISLSDSMLAEEKEEEALAVIEEALDLIPESDALAEKKSRIQNSQPQNMMEVVSAYQSGGNPYIEYCSSSGETDSFFMAGMQYRDGMTFNADYNVLEDRSWALYNLDGKYAELEFTVGHVDGTDTGATTYLQIFYDGTLEKEIELTPDMLPQKVILDVTKVQQLKMQVPSSGGRNPVYGVADPVLKEAE